MTEETDETMSETIGNRNENDESANVLRRRKFVECAQETIEQGEWRQLDSLIRKTIFSIGIDKTQDSLRWSFLGTETFVAKKSFDTEL